MQKEKITNSLNYFSTKLLLGLCVFGIAYFGYLLIQEISTPATSLFSTKVFGLFCFLVFYVFISTKIFKRFQGITILYASDFGIHSQTEKVEWEVITDITWEDKYNLPILFVEYNCGDEKKVLKTTLPSLEKRSENSYKRVWEKWVNNKNS